MAVAIHVEQVSKFTLEKDSNGAPCNVRMCTVSNGEPLVLFFRYDQFLAGHERVKEMLAEHLAKSKVVPLRRR